MLRACPRSALELLIRTGLPALLLGACGPADEGGVTAADPPEAAPVSHVARGLAGVPQGGFPSWQERVVLVLTNRARSDPAAQSQETCGGGCASYAPSAPLTHDHAAARAARFHATSLKKAGAGLQHDSVCKLVSNIGQIYPDQCDGDPSCACDGGQASCSCSGGSPYCSCPGGCTSTFSRIGMFGVSGRGENAAAGNTDPVKTFGQWVKSSGHWSIINKSSHGRLGVGEYSGPGQGCWGAFWVQVFAGGSVSPGLAGGAHYPQSTGPGGTVTFWANWHDPAGAPQMATVNVGGTCHKLSVERGNPGSGTYRADLPLSGKGCQRYVFVFRDAAGKLHTLPEQGSYGVAAGGGGASCEDYAASQRPSLGQGCGGCQKAADCDDGNPCTKDACAANKCQNTQVKGCCQSAAQCDDGNPCTQDACQGNQCRSTPVKGCCQSAAQCADGNPCTEDRCKASRCENAPVPGCSGCQKPADCADGDPCTTDTCQSGKCGHVKVPGCGKTPSSRGDGGHTTDGGVAYDEAGILNLGAPKGPAGNDPHPPGDATSAGCAIGPPAPGSHGPALPLLPALLGLLACARAARRRATGR